MVKRSEIPFVSGVHASAQQQWLEHLQAALPAHNVTPFRSDADYADIDVAIVANPNPQHLKQMPNLRWVQSLWAGVEPLVSELPMDVAVVRMTDPQLAQTMAEAVLTMTLSLHRDLPTYAAQQADRIWRPLPPVLAKDRKVGVLGLGHLGCAACDVLSAHGFDVRGWSRTPKSIPQVHCYAGEQGLTDLLRVVDILVVLLPLTDQTRGLLNKDCLSLLKPGASLINFARAEVIDTDGLVALLEAGQLAHAVLDVFETEPLPPAHRLWEVENLTILPHISAPTNMQTAAEIVARNISSYFATGHVPNVVDREKGY